MNISKSSITAKKISIRSDETKERILLTGGLTAVMNDDNSVCFYPIWEAGQLAWGPLMTPNIFKQYIKKRKIEIVGVKQLTSGTEGTYWRWAPAVDCHDPPDNNPYYQWQFLSASIKRTIEAGENYPSLKTGAVQSISDAKMKQLAIQANHIAISLHQMNFAIVSMAEYFHHELVLKLSSQDAGCGRYAHIRSHDLVAYVHSFFQAYSAARDHYAQFLAVQTSSKEIDSMAKLLKNTCPVELRVLPMIKALEIKKLLSIQKISVEKDQPKVDRLQFCDNTWLSYTNKLRNRFTHKKPYGAFPDEAMTEVYRAENDHSLLLVKAFLDKGREKAPSDLLRTTNHLYQSICGFFLNAADLIGYKTAPLTIVA